MKKVTILVSLALFVAAGVAVVIAVSECLSKKRRLCDCECFDDEMFDSTIDFDNDIEMAITSEETEEEADEPIEDELV